MSPRTLILEGLLDNDTSIDLSEIMSDTAGASDIIFGLFWLLGYQFSPLCVPKIGSWALTRGNEGRC